MLKLQNSQQDNLFVFVCASLEGRISSHQRIEQLWSDFCKFYFFDTSN